MTIDDIAGANGSKQADCVAALASFVKREMESGKKVNLGDLWMDLQRAPFGYYNTIACGVLLGYIFSCYRNSKYTWTDSVQSPHVLADATISKMVSSICQGKMTTDYLSAGSITWQHFSEYLGKIFGLSDGELAEQTTGYHNVREAVTKSGAPFWTLKYIPEDAWNNTEFKNAAENIINDIQIFITQDGDVEGAMSDVLQLMQGRGKIRVVLAKYFQDKNALSTAFRAFLFNASPELKEIANKLSIQPEELSDKLHLVMQDAIYTWSEDQVKEKLEDVAGEYKYLEALGNVQGTNYHSIDSAKKDFANLFKYLRISLAAIEAQNKPWFPALAILRRVAQSGIDKMQPQDRERDIAILSQYGEYAKGCLTDGKPILSDILASKQIECTKEELDTIYGGLKDLSCDASLMQFEKELNIQISRISFARNKTILQERWRSLSGEETVRSWCNSFAIPLMWIIPKEDQKAFATLIDVQKKSRTMDSAVISAIETLNKMDSSILTDAGKANAAFANIIGAEYADIWATEKTALMAEAKLKFGNDMSDWSTSDLAILQRIMKRVQQEKAKKEKLSDTKKSVQYMNESLLRDRVIAFLDSHPEFCDSFTD